MTMQLALSNRQLLQYAVRPYGFTTNSMDVYDYPSTFRSFDLVLDALESWRYFIPAGPTSICSLIRDKDTSDTLTYFGISDPVELRSPAEVEARQDAYYRNFFDNIRLFENALTGKPDMRPASTREHPCIQCTYTGSVMPAVQPLPTVEYTLNFLGHNRTVRRLDGRVSYRASVLSLDPTDTFLIFDSSPEYHQLSFIDWLKLVKEAGETSQNLFGSPWFYWTRTLKDVEYNYTATQLEVTWVTKVHTEPFPGWPDGEDTQYDGYLKIPLGVLPKNSTITTPGTAIFSSGLPHTFGYKNATRRHPQPTDGPTSFEWVNDTCHPHIALSYPSGNDSITDVEYFQSIIRWKGHALRKHSDANFWHLAASVANSSSDAVLDLEGSAGINILQNLQKIPDIASMLPQVKEAVKVMTKLLKRDFRLRTFKEVVDLISSTKLQADFQWGPTLGLFTEYLPSIKKILTQDLNTPVITGRGKYSTKLPSGSLNRHTCNLTARTKIVLSSRYDKWLPGLLRADSFGALPKISNLWDLVPFTFAVNWFTGIGKSIRSAEASLLLHNVPAYYLHTIKLETPLLSEELLEIGLSPGEFGIEPSIGVYYRDFTICSPMPRDNKYLIGLPTNLPPLGTVGALLWQLILG